MAVTREMQDVVPGWVAFFQIDGETYISPIACRFVKLVDHEDDVGVQILHYCPPPIGDGPLLIAESVQGFTGVDFLPMRAMAEQSGSKLWKPGMGMPGFGLN